MTQQDNEKPQTTVTPKVNELGLRGAIFLAGGGLLGVILLIVILLAFNIKTSNDIVAIVGVFTSVLGSLVGLIVGNGVGSQGKAASDKRADVAQQHATDADKKVAANKVVAGVIHDKLTKQKQGGTLKIARDSEAANADLDELSGLVKKILES